MSSLWEIRCSRCHATRMLGLVERIDRLRQLGMLRQEARPEAALVDELFRAAQDRLRCSDCGAIGLSAAAIDEELEDAAWGTTRSCADCGAAIPRERLELFPDTRLCVACQSRDERGEAPQAVEYCPKCGNAMTLATSRTAGITRYVMTCANCRRR